MEGNSTSHNTVATPDILVLSSGMVTYILFIATTGILIIMIVFGHQHKRWSFTNGKGQIFMACFAAILLGWLRLIPYLYIFHTSYDSDVLRHCELIVDVAYFFVGIGIMSIYLFLWLRQRLIYSTHIVKCVASKWIHYISKYSIIWILFSTIILLLGYLIPVNYRAGPRGCEYIPSGNQTDPTYRDWNIVRKYVVLATVAMTEILLVLLFIYPMVKVRIELRSQQDPSAIDTSGTSTNMIRRSLICSVIVLIVDVIFFIILRRLTDVVLMAHLFTQIGIFLNQVAIITSLGDCRSMLSMRCRCRTHDELDTATTNHVPVVCKSISLPIDTRHTRMQNT